MKTVLCYGDSITWGSNAETGERHAFEDCWPNVLQKALGADVRVITEGLRGRTTAYDEHLADCDRNGARILPTILYTHAPLDLVIFMLGSNDMKPAIAGSALAAMQGMRRLVAIADARPVIADRRKILAQRREGARPRPRIAEQRAGQRLLTGDDHLGRIDHVAPGRPCIALLAPPMHGIAVFVLPAEIVPVIHMQRQRQHVVAPGEVMQQRIRRRA